MGSMQSLIVSEAEKFSNGSTLLNTLALYEAALDDPDTYPVIAGVYEIHTVRGAKYYYAPVYFWCREGAKI